MTKQNWNAAKYGRDASFVSQLGNPVLQLLAPQSGEKILDLGCGDGDLTLQIQNCGCEILGIDSSADMIAAASQKGLTTRVLDARDLNYSAEFNAVFTNAVLHWISDIDLVVNNVYRALKPEGRFVGEFGGAGNIQSIVDALVETFREDDFGKFENPWYFPSVSDLRMVLERSEFIVDYIELIPRPTPLKSGVHSWLEIFTNGITHHLDSERKKQLITKVAQKLKPHIYSSPEGWVADYVRIRFRAIKQA